MNDEEIKQYLKDHPENLYRGSGTDRELSELMNKWSKEMESTPWKKCYSREYCLDIVKNIPVTCLKEMLDNAEKVMEWLEGGV